MIQKQTNWQTQCRRTKQDINFSKTKIPLPQKRPGLLSLHTSLASLNRSPTTSTSQSINQSHYSHSPSRGFPFFSLQWRPCRSTSLRFLRSAPVVPLPRPPLHWFPSAGGRNLAANYPATVGELSRGPSSEQWFSRPCRELRPPMLRKWRGFPLKNRSFSP